MPNIQLAKNLRHLRKRHNLTQTALSQMLNVSRQAYSNYETGKRTPDLDALLHLADFYHISLNHLILGSLSSEKKTGNPIYLTDEELDTVLRFRTLSNENKQIITGFLHSISVNPD